MQTAKESTPANCRTQMDIHKMNNSDQIPSFLLMSNVDKLINCDNENGNLDLKQLKKDI